MLKVAFQLLVLTRVSMEHRAPCVHAVILVMTQKLLLSFFAKAASRNQNLALAELPDYVSCFSCEQRWSRGHKAQGQGHKKNPRPRTAVSRTHALEAKDRIARSQGPRTQSQVFSKQKQKKGLQKVFQAISNS